MPDVDAGHAAHSHKADFADGNWMVSGTLPAGIKGGNPYVIIKDRDKKILDVNRSNSMKIRCIRNSHINRWIV